jgi:hypothetical protein
MKYLIMTLAIFMSVSLAATEEKSRIALVIGNSAYKDIPALKNPVNDASDVAASLRRMGWRVMDIYDANRRDILRAIGSFQDALRGLPGSMALFYYAGHGVQVDGKNYLLPLSESFELKDDIKIGGVCVDEIATAFSEGEAATCLTILDACRDDPFAKSKTRAIATTRGLSVIPAVESQGGSATIFATAAGDVAQDGEGRNGIFTSALLSYMESGASLADIFLAVAKDVREATAGRQNPFVVSSGIISTIYLSKPAAGAGATSSAGLPAAAPTSNEGRALFRSPIAGTIYLGSEPIGDVGPGKTLLADALPTGRLDFNFESADGSAQDRQSATISSRAMAELTFNSRLQGVSPADAVITASASKESQDSSALQRSARLAALRLERQGLQSAIDAKNKKGRPAMVANAVALGGLAISASGLVISLLAGDGAVQAYNAAATVPIRDAKASEIGRLNTFYKASQLGTAVFGAASLGTLFLLTSTAKEKEAMRALDRQISELGE